MAGSDIQIQEKPLDTFVRVFPVASVMGVVVLAGAGYFVVDALSTGSEAGDAYDKTEMGHDQPLSGFQVTKAYQAVT